MAFSFVNENIYYDTFLAIDKLNLDIKKGEKVALLGRSGSGKSTLLRRMYELQKKCSSYIPQELGLVDNLSVFHNVYISQLDKKSFLYNVSNLLFPKKEERKNVLNILDRTSLVDKLFSKVSNLSGGQKQRVAISRALYDDKSILLADEPISALDEYLAKQMLYDLTRSYETVICTLHNVELAVENFDRVVGLKDGKLILNKACKDLTHEDRQDLYYAVK